MESEKKRGRPKKRSCDSSNPAIPLAIRRLDVRQRNETLFSERTHLHQESSQNNLIIVNNNLNQSLFTNESLSNLRIVNNSLNQSLFSNESLSNLRIVNNMLNQSLFSNESLSNLRIINISSNINNILSNNESLFTNENYLIDFEKINLFNFEREFGYTDANVFVKLRAIGLLIPPDDPELYKCPKCGGSLRRTEEPNRVLGYRFHCRDYRCNGIVNPADNTWFSGLRKTEINPNPVLRSLKHCFSLLCCLGVGLTTEATDCDPKTTRKIFRLVRSISSHHLKSTTWTIGGQGLTIECEESHIFKRKYNRGRMYVLEDWWMFGAICRETGECFAMVVPDRTKNTLWPLMASRIAAGSTVYTDSAAVYDGITGLGMNWIHLKVNHRKTFVRHVLYRGHVYIVHTNTIERLWRHIKSFIRSPQSLNFLFEQVDWSIYYRIFLKDKPKGMAFKKFLEDTTQYLSGPSQMS
jgi:transposase-like protein